MTKPIVPSSTTHKDSNYADNAEVKILNPQYDELRMSPDKNPYQSESPDKSNEHRVFSGINSSIKPASSRHAPSKSQYQSILKDESYLALLSEEKQNNFSPQSKNDAQSLLM